MTFATENTAATDTNAAEFANQAVAGKPVALTKEEKLAKIDAQILKLQQRRADIENGVERPAKAAKKEAVLPNVGDVVTFLHGRKTATTNPTEQIGTVLAVKPAVPGVDGKKGQPAYIKVQFGEGFDTETAVIFVGQIIEKSAE